MRRTGIAVVVAAFIALQAANSAAVSIMSLFVTETLGLDVMWAGVAFGVAAGLEIPALLLIGGLSYRFSDLRLIASGCAVGIVYYAAMVFFSGPVLLIGLQVLDAWFFAVVAGVGLTLFQHIIPRPGLASGLFVNTRRLGAIVSGAVISFGSLTPLGYGGIFAACAGFTALALVAISMASRITKRDADTQRPRRRRMMVVSDTSEQSPLMSEHAPGGARRRKIWRGCLNKSGAAAALRLRQICQVVMRTAT